MDEIKLPINSCPICKIEKIKSINSDYQEDARQYYCPNCGNYSITYSAYRFTPICNDEDTKAKISYHIRNNTKEEQPIFISQTDVGEIVNSTILPPIKTQLDNLLIWFNKKSMNSLDPVDGHTYYLPASIGAKKPQQVIILLDQLVKDNYIEMENPPNDLRNCPAFDVFCAHLTLKGLNRMQELNSPNSIINYKFKKYLLPNDEKIWLTELLKYDFGKADAKQIKVKLWDQLSKNFDPSKIDHRLCRENRLTLFGLWLIKPDHPIISYTTKVINSIKVLINSNPSLTGLDARNIADSCNISVIESRIVLTLLWDFGYFSGGSKFMDEILFLKVSFYTAHNAFDRILSFTNLEEELEKFFDSGTKQKYNRVVPVSAKSKVIKPILDGKKDVWKEIENEFHLTKRAVGKKLNFIKSSKKKKILFRDIEHSYYLSKYGSAKPAIILAGGVIEELLKSHLEHKNINTNNKSFDDIIKLCKEHDSFLDIANLQLSDSARLFRNYVHIDKETKSKLKISSPMSSSAVSTIFTVISNF